MSNYGSYRHNTDIRPNVIRPIQQELERVPRRFCEYMDEENNRFSEICRLYLACLSMDDIKYLKPEDLINLVPHDHHEHKLLMTIMVRRYLCRSMHSSKHSSDEKIYFPCKKCNHKCTNFDCNHSCDDYTKSDDTSDRYSH
jgi:hypothetical protein